MPPAGGPTGLRQLRHLTGADWRKPTQNSALRGVPPSKGNPCASSVYTIGNLTDWRRKKPLF